MAFIVSPVFLYDGSESESGPPHPASTNDLSVATLACNIIYILAKASALFFF